MKRFLICLLLLWAGEAASQEAPQLTLIRCYELARAHYPLIRQYDLIAQTESYNVANAGKAWLPQLALNARATYQSDVTTLPFDAGRLSALIPGFDIPTVSKDQYQVTAEITQTLWDGGHIRSAQTLAHAQAETERKQLESELYALRERINQVFFGCLLQDELLRQNTLLQKELEVNAGRIAAMMDQGMANESDRDALEVERLKAHRQAIELQAGRKAYLAVLSALTGQEIGETASLIVPSMPGEALKTGINRPEMEAFAALKDRIGVQRRQLTAQLMPRIGLFVQGGYGRPGLNMLADSFEPFYVAGLRLSWNFGQFYTLANDRRKIETSLRSVDVQREAFLFNTTLRIVRRDTDIDMMYRLLDTDSEILRLRTSIRQAAEVKLEGGVIAVADLIREINAEDLARQTSSTHRIQLLTAIYDLSYLTAGNILP
ncbi:MAG: TolC family protein [Tannerellaceae bacterium]|jgi:outer membrane protein TolC|nr:TolC family protein [Tannerellaceae bacterium]